MIDIEELRARTWSSGVIPLNYKTVSELLDRLEAAEKEREIDEQRIADLMAELNRVGHENDALRAKIEQMERQEPVAFGLYSGWALKATYLKEHEACEQRDRRQLTADLGGSLEAYRVAPLYALPGAKPAPSFADAYQGAMEEVAIWKKRALEAEDMNRKFVAEINGPMLMGEPVAQPAPSTPDDVMRDAKRYRFLRAAKNIPISSKAARDPVVYDAAIDAAMLAAAPEAKP